MPFQQVGPLFGIRFQRPGLPSKEDSRQPPSFALELFDDLQRLIFEPVDNLGDAEPRIAAPSLGCPPRLSSKVAWRHLWVSVYVLRHWP